MCERDKLAELLRMFEAYAEAQKDAKNAYISVEDYRMATEARDAEMAWDRAAEEVKRMIRNTNQGRMR